VEHWIDFVFLAVSDEDPPARIESGKKNGRKLSLPPMWESPRGTINAIETDKYDPSLPLALRSPVLLVRAWKRFFLYQENEQPATTNPAV